MPSTISLHSASLVPRNCLPIKDRTQQAPTFSTYPRRSNSVSILTGMMQVMLELTTMLKRVFHSAAVKSFSVIDPAPQLFNN
ncbi:hypothetical protein OH818_04125 [Jiella pelagia]|uniref:Uncharacterized protein n=1 Tax=Jiella pelagia TaxID=2986949 RepID=A0ABY7C022_9HYPH|nr:hypothetical protein OH818_04125 [Jiella pelagia]